MNDELNASYSFGEFELDAGRRLLLKRGEAVNLNPKAFDLLLTLVANHGQVLTKSDLLDKVWENQFVEENNLTVHVAALRKALGETKNDHRFIVTVPGKGYRFVAQLNQPTNGEIVVESHKFEHIVVQEEIEEKDDGDLAVTRGIYESARPATTATKRRSVGVAITAALVLAAVAGGYALRERLSSDRTAAVPFVSHNARQLTTNGKVGSAALSPDGKLFAYTTDDVGRKSLWIGNVDGGNHLLLRPAAEVSFRTIVFSPDGGQLYFSLRDEKNPKGACSGFRPLAASNRK